MAKTKKELIELLKFTVNEKANYANAQKHVSADENKKRSRANFWHGQYIAFNEIYTMLEGIERIENDE